MIICYKKLWKLLIDKGLNKTDLQRSMSLGLSLRLTTRIPPTVR